MERIKPWLKDGWIVVPVVLLLYGLHVFFFNPTASAPIGIWKWTKEAIKPGVYVVLNNPMKQVAAVAGAQVKFTAEGVYINGELIKNSAPEKGIPHYPFTELTVPDGWFVGISKAKDAFDGRYTGPLPLALSVGTARPVWVMP